jgi:transcriptional regulator with XRE-family HTH domain
MEELSFGQWLSRQRKSLGLTQKQLAEKINCATITVRKMEAEQRRPSQQVMERLAQVLNIPFDQQITFFRYARGDEQHISPITSEDFPWHRSVISFNPDMLTSVIKHIGHDHIHSKMKDFYLDDHIHLIDQIETTEKGNPDLYPDATHGDEPKFRDSLFFIMLVPIEIPSHLAVTFIQTLGFDEAAGKFTSEH